MGHVAAMEIRKKFYILFQSRYEEKFDDRTYKGRIGETIRY